MEDHILVLLILLSYGTYRRIILSLIYSDILPCIMLIMSPVYRGWNILLCFSSLICSSDQCCVCAFSPSIMQAVKHETLTHVGLLLTHRLRRWASISPVLGYRVVFDATLNVGSVTDVLCERILFLLTCSFLDFQNIPKHSTKDTEQ